MEFIFSQAVSFFSAFLWGLSSLWATPPAVVPLPIMGTTTAQVVEVIDGDTIVVTLSTSTTRTKVRYIGIDTPEPYAHKIPDCGSKEATNRNKELVENQIVTVVPGRDAYDTYGRLLAYVYMDSVFVNETLVREGYASVLMIKPNTQFKTSFTNLYTYARIHEFGIWSVCDK